MEQPTYSAESAATPPRIDQLADEMTDFASGARPESLLLRVGEQGSPSPMLRGIGGDLDTAVDGSTAIGGMPCLSSAEFSAILPVISDGVVVFDHASGAVRVANTAAADILGQPLGATFPVGGYVSLCGFSHLNGRDCRPNELGLTAISNNSSRRVEVTIRRPDGSRRHAFSTSITTVDANGLASTLQVLHDLTSLREMESWAAHLLSTVSHELKNPLTSLKGFTALVLRRREYNEEFMLAIKEQCERLHRMIDLVVRESRVAMGGFTLNASWTDVSRPLREALEDTRPEFDGLSAHLRVSTDSPSGYWDGLRLRRAFAALLRRGIFFAGARGDVMVAQDALPEKVHLSITCRRRAESYPPGLDRRHTGAAGGDACGTPDLLMDGEFHVARSIIHQHGGEVSVEQSAGDTQLIVATLPYHP